MAVRPCCQCNCPNAKCLHCSCVRSVTTCTHCHPSQSGRCWNVLRSTRGSSNIPSNQVSYPTVTLTATCSYMSPHPVSSLPNLQPGDSPHLLSLVNLPSFPSTSRVHVLILHHVPKGTHDMWSGLFTIELNSVLSFPLDMKMMQKIWWCKKMVQVYDAGQMCFIETLRQTQFPAWHVKNCYGPSEVLVWGWLYRSLARNHYWRVLDQP